MTQGAGPVTAGSITSQMSGIGPGTTNAPTTGYPDPGGPADSTNMSMSGAPGMIPTDTGYGPQMNGGIPMNYSTGNPFATPPPSNADPGDNGFDISDARRDRYQNDRFGGGFRGALNTA